MSELFRGMSSTTTWSNDLLLFLNVINGALILHCEDIAVLRLTLATFISASRHFKQVFSTNGSVAMETYTFFFDLIRFDSIRIDSIRFEFFFFFIMCTFAFHVMYCSSRLCPTCHSTQMYQNSIFVDVGLINKSINNIIVCC